MTTSGTRSLFTGGRKRWVWFGFTVHMMLTNSALLEHYIAFWLHYSVVLEIKQYVGFINIQPILHCGEKIN
jgi:hypothetical protein